MSDRSYRRVPIAEIRALLGRPEPAVEAKVGTALDLTARRFIAHAPFVCLATVSAGGADCSPRGDGPGFVRVLDDRTVVLPDRTGNNLSDTFGNVAENPAVGMLFLVPGLRETLRVNGRGYVTDDSDLLDVLTTDARRPRLALVVEVEEVYFHCGKALIRSRLWDPSMQALAAAATRGRNVFSLQRVERNRVTVPPDEMQAALERSYVTEL